MSTPDGPAGPTESSQSPAPSGEGRDRPPEDGPRFGQRSSDWVPNDDRSDFPARSGPGSATGPSPTPWPQYGQIPQSGSGSAWPQAGQTPSGRGSWSTQGQSSRPHLPPDWSWPPDGAPGEDGSRASGGQGSPAAALPSRTGAIVSVVVGIVTMVVMAPIVALSVILSGMNISELTQNVGPVSTGATVQVDRSGTYIVTSTTNQSISCTLTGQDGSVLQLQALQGQTSVALGSSIAEGAYTLDCGSATDLVGMTGISVDSLANAGARGVLWASVVGVAGLIVTIVGIVALVRINRRRNDIQRRMWGRGPGPYGGGPRTLSGGQLPY